MPDSVQSHDPATSDDRNHSHLSARIPWWVTLVVLLGAALLTAGAMISKLAPTMLTDGEAMTGAARVYADYLFARNLPLALMLLFLLVLRSRHMLAGMMILIALIQLFDATNDLVRGDIVLVPGVLLFALVFVIGASRLFGQAPWHGMVWREAP
jgi:hypothetical protein